MKADKYLIESIALLYEIFDDFGKVCFWLNTENPLLGNTKPIVYFENGRGGKVLKFIKSAIDENRMG